MIRSVIWSWMSSPRRGGALAAIIFLFVALPIRAWDFAWLTQFGTPASDELISVATDATGIYSAGSVDGPLPGQTHAGFYDAFLRKYDRTGAILWTVQFGTGTSDGAFDVHTDTTGVYIGGFTFGRLPGEVRSGSGDLFVRKYTTGGEELWTTQFGTNGNELPVFASTLAVHATGIYVTGGTTGAFPGQVNRGGFDVILAKLDPSTGALQWVRQFGTPGDDITGTLFGGVAADDTGAYVVANLFESPGFFFPEFRKYDSAGNLLWSGSVGRGDCRPVVTGVATHATGVYVSGQDFAQPYEPGADCVRGGGANAVAGVVIRHDTEGNAIWTRTLKGGPPNSSGFTGGKGVAVFDSGVYMNGNLTEKFAGDTSEDADGSKQLCGTHVDAFFGRLDAYVRRFDFDGNVIWTRQLGGPNFEIAWDVASDGTSLFLGGITDCIVAPGQTWFGRSDGFISRLEVDPTSMSGRIQLIVGRLETFFAASELGHGDFNSLAGDLEAALGGLAKSRSNVARNNLEGFIDHVDALEDAGALSAANAAALRSAASAILADL